MNSVLFAYPGHETLAQDLLQLTGLVQGQFILHHFPDGESYIRVQSLGKGEADVSGKQAIVLCTLAGPDAKLLPLLFLAETLKDLGAKKVGLVAPYLAYLRQDRRFQDGEGVSSRYFGKLISGYFDWLVTIDPHLHRYASLEPIYAIPTCVLHATEKISAWIKEHVAKPLLVGPDAESEQWVAAVAKLIGCDFIVLQKTRRGDREVSVSVPDIEKWLSHQPVLIDDIISTAHTMIETVAHLRRMQLKPPICIGVHGIFAGDSYNELLKAGAGRILTTNTIPHTANTPSSPA